MPERRNEPGGEAQIPRPCRSSPQWHHSPGARVTKPQQEPEGRPPDIGRHQSSCASSSNNCSTQNTRRSLTYLGPLGCPREFTYCHNQNSSDEKPVPRQPNPSGSRTPLRGWQRRQVSHRKPLWIFPSLLRSPSFQHFVSYRSSSNLSKAFWNIRRETVNLRAPERQKFRMKRFARALLLK